MAPGPWKIDCPFYALPDMTFHELTMKITDSFASIELATAAAEWYGLQFSPMVAELESIARGELIGIIPNFSPGAKLSTYWPLMKMSHQNLTSTLEENFKESLGANGQTESAFSDIAPVTHVLEDK